MNKQGKTKNGQVVSRGIEWTEYTHNPAAEPWREEFPLENPF